MRPWWSCLVGLWLSSVLVEASPHAVAAQEESPGLGAPDEERASFWSGVAGSPADRRRAIFGLWSMHPYEPQFPEVEWTRGFGFAFAQWFGATFVNSYDERSFIVGLERYWARGRHGFVGFGLGYRAGLVTGYDERLVSWAEDLPVLPFAGIVGWVDVGPAGVDVYYVYRAITLETSVRF
jgi:hypothetical protein